MPVRLFACKTRSGWLPTGQSWFWLILGGIPPTRWVSLLANIYVYQFNLLFVCTKVLKQHAPAVLVYLCPECFCVEEY